MTSQSQPEGTPKSVATEAPPSAPWETLAAEFTKAAADALEPHIRELADDIYWRLMNGVQDYLCDNVQFNIASRLESAERERREQWERAEAATAENHHLRYALKLTRPAFTGCDCSASSGCSSASILATIDAALGERGQ